MGKYSGKEGLSYRQMIQREDKAEGKRRVPLLELGVCQPISSKTITLALGEGIITRL